MKKLDLDITCVGTLYSRGAMKELQCTWCHMLFNMLNVLATLLVASAFTAGTTLHLRKYNDTPTIMP